MLCCKKLLLGFLALFPGLCLAASVNIAPVRLELDPGARKSSFKIVNPSTEPVLFQLQAVKWTQENGEDIYTETKDLIINPPIASIEPGTYQLVRVGLKAAQNPATEHAYRIIATQVPSETEKSGGVQLKTVLKISVPLFVRPKKPTTDLNFITKRLPDGTLELQLLNKSNRHIQIMTVDFYQAEGEKPVATPMTEKDRFVYLLPGQEHKWPVKWKAPADAKDVVLKLRTDWGRLEQPIAIISE
jgi:fimbrial chaperone protein